MKMEAFALSDIGPIRDTNEDAWVICPEIGFCAPSDGLGGHPAGEVAAFEATKTVLKAIAKAKTSPLPLNLFDELIYGVEEANRWVYQMGRGCSTLRGMGATLCCILQEQEQIHCAHVGDSRVYRSRGGLLELLTKDHATREKKLTKIIGSPHPAKPDVKTFTPLPGDLFLLASDGLTDRIPLPWLEEALARPLSLESYATLLIEEAKNRGSRDNMTAIVVRIL